MRASDNARADAALASSTTDSAVADGASRAACTQGTVVLGSDVHAATSTTRRLRRCSRRSPGATHVAADMRRCTTHKAANPHTVLFNKVTTKGAKQAVQMFGPAQAAGAKQVSGANR
jgi:formaldehyde-activating enzyme involved in methanogenesis